MCLCKSRSRKAFIDVPLTGTLVCFGIDGSCQTVWVANSAILGEVKGEVAEWSVLNAAISTCSIASDSELGIPD